MKNYTKEQIEQIVNDLSEKIVNENVIELENQLPILIQKNDQVKKIKLAIKFMLDFSQENAKRLIIESLNKVLND